MTGDDHLGIHLDVAHGDAGQRAFVPIGASRVQRHRLAEYEIGQRPLQRLPSAGYPCHPAGTGPLSLVVLRLAGEGEVGPLGGTHGNRWAADGVPPRTASRTYCVIAVCIHRLT